MTTTTARWESPCPSCASGWPSGSPTAAAPPLSGSSWKPPGPHNVWPGPALFYGSDYEFAFADSGARFTWSLEAPEPGTYAVQACWASGIDRAPDAPYTIARNGQPLTTTRVDQSSSGGFWVELGHFDFAAGDLCTVTLTAEASGEVVIADAVRLLLVVSGK